MKEEYRVRQADIINSGVLGQRINIVGVGAIGSHLTYMLARMGFTNIGVWDFDTVDAVNLSSQGFSIEDIGLNKTQAVAQRVYKDVGTMIETFPRKWTPDVQLSGVVVAAADSMEVRKQLWNQASSLFFVDARMGAEYLQVYAYRTAAERYESHKHSLFSDEEAAPVPCTAKATIYCASIISGIIAGAIKQYLHGQPFCSYIAWNIAKNTIDALESISE